MSGHFSMMVRDLQLLPEAAAALLKCFPSQKIFVFYGEMGAGKTTFIKQLCEVLGTTEALSSPTYALVNEYNAASQRIFHMDLYRLNDLEEALQIGIEEYLDDKEAYCFIEWPQLIETLLPLNAVKVSIAANEDGYRIIDAI
jgi:tRNA threonylcarbamoyladenosine biosynthesis protein TsaE